MLLKSPVNRTGGKYYLTGWLSEMIPSHVLYCEAFAGAGHLLFAKSPSPVEIINDIDGHLIGLFRVIQHPEKRLTLVERLQYMPYSRSLWQEIRTQWKQGALPQDEIERAAAWFYLNKTCFSGDMLSGGFAVPSTTGRNTAQSYHNAIDGIEHIGERLRGVTIECLPYDEGIRRYDSDGSLFYVDPPYHGAEGYYGDSFGQDDHHRLSKLLHGIKGMAMVSHYQNSLYDELYQGWHRYEYESFKGSHKAASGESKPATTEVLYTNFEQKQRSLFDV